MVADNSAGFFLGVSKMHISNDRCKALIIKIMKQVGVIVGCPVTLLPPNWASVTKDSALPPMNPWKDDMGSGKPPYIRFRAPGV